MIRHCFSFNNKTKQKIEIDPISSNSKNSVSVNIANLNLSAGWVVVSINGIKTIFNLIIFYPFVDWVTVQWCVITTTHNRSTAINTP